MSLSPWESEKRKRLKISTNLAKLLTKQNKGKWGFLFSFLLPPSFSFLLCPCFLLLSLHNLFSFLYSQIPLKTKEEEEEKRGRVLFFFDKEWETPYTQHILNTGNLLLWVFLLGSLSELGFLSFSLSLHDSGSVSYGYRVYNSYSGWTIIGFHESWQKKDQVTVIWMRSKWP